LYKTCARDFGLKGA
jgi:hypothetical protein